MGVVLEREFGVPETNPKAPREREDKKEEEVEQQRRNQNPPVSCQDETDHGRPFVFFDPIHFANAVADDGFKKNGPV